MEGRGGDWRDERKHKIIKVYLTSSFHVLRKIKIEGKQVILFTLYFFIIYQVPVIDSKSICSMI